MIKAIFWDNDGVLVDTERLYFLATQQTLATVGVPLTKEQYIELFLLAVKGSGFRAVRVFGNGSPLGVPLKLRREPLQAGLDFAHEVQGAGDTDHVRGLRLTACLRQGHHRVRLKLYRHTMLAHQLC